MADPSAPPDIQALAEALRSVAENLAMQAAEIRQLRADLRTHVAAKGLDVSMVVDALLRFEEPGLVGRIGSARFGTDISLKLPKAG